MSSDFNSLTTERLRQKLVPFAMDIYKRIFNGCRVEYLKSENGGVHILDKEYGIDCLIHLKNGQWISVQEKYRDNSALKYLDFTQEYKNAAGTEYENNGEWFHLGAQVYFYGWANKNNTGFEKWFLMDIVKYKILVEQSGGIDSMGVLRHNATHGKASFYAIKIAKLESCFITDYRKYNAFR